jgi:putative molybdopterin biosynthesis protein
MSDIISVTLNYDFAAAGDRQLRNRFFEVLGAIRQEGSIAAAARRLDCSYRYLWGWLKDQEARLGRELILWDRGRAARLSPFADKLLWAETRIRARLAPEIDNLAARIGRELTVAFDDQVTIATCVASHDLALPALRALCEERDGVLFDLRFDGSLEALRALRARRCLFAGIHLPCSRPDLARRGSALHRAFGPLLRLGREKLIRVGRRTQGLMLPAGNPRRVQSIAQLKRLRFVNRAAGTGTRALLDELLAAEGIATASIGGYERTEDTHVAVAAAVAEGRAEAGFGIQAAAESMGLAFLPLVTEDYFLVCDKETLEGEAGRSVVGALGSEGWRDALAALPGYEATDAGRVLSLRRTLPWYA